MKELIFRHLTASRKNLRFGLILSLGLFVFTFLIYLSAVCGNLKAMGIAESEVFPYLIMTFISLTAIVPMMTGLAGQSMKKDSDSGFDRFMLASPVSVEKDVLSLYLFIIIMTGGSSSCRYIMFCADFDSRCCRCDIYSDTDTGWLFQNKP